MDFRIVERYHRQEHFDFYSKYGWPFYAATVRFDITALKEWAAERGHSTYLSLCYYFTRAAQAIEDFRYRIRDGRIVLYERLHPGLTVPAPGGLFSLALLNRVRSRPRLKPCGGGHGASKRLVCPWMRTYVQRYSI